MKDMTKSIVGKVFCPKLYRDLGVTMCVFGVGFGIYFLITLLMELARCEKGEGHPFWPFVIVLVCILSFVKGMSMYDENCVKCK